MLVACNVPNSDSVLPSVPFADESTFFVRFIDVGQGDSALVCCDGHYMLIDGGPEKAGEKVKAVLDEYSVRHLDYLVISHMHEDHIGGLSEALRRITRIDKTLSNVYSIRENDSLKEDEEEELKNKSIFKEVERQLIDCGGHITVPAIGRKPYKLGSAKIEIIACDSRRNNDSLVILITYRKNRFLFTGDMQKNMEEDLCKKYGSSFYKVDVLKVAHHGSTTSTTPAFAKMISNSTNDKYAVISVGKNSYGHPDDIIINRLKNRYKWKVYITEKVGDILIKSDGKQLDIETE